MAFRRRPFVPNRPGFMNRFRRRGGRLREASKDSKWEYANFHVATQTNVAADTVAPIETTNTVVELIKIWEHVADPNETFGGVLPAMVKHIDVHSMIFTIQTVMNQGEVEVDAKAWMQTWHYVCTANLNEVGDPYNALPNLARTQIPIVNAGSLAGGSDELENRYPVRFHYRNFYLDPIGSQNETVPRDTQTHFNVGMRRLRLRRRFSDREGLYIGAAFLHSAPDTVTMTTVIDGALWYKISWS